MMIRILALCFLATTAQAQPPSAARIQSSASPGTCTAALLAPDLLITAAHCLDPTRDVYALQPFEGAAQPIVAITRHPVYSLASGRSKFRFDLALGELADDVATPPLRVGPVPVVGERLAIETWRRDTRVPQHRRCSVLAVLEGEVVLDCAVAQGHSGAPVLRFTDEGPEIVAILVATTTAKGHPAALGVTLQNRIEVLMQAAGRQ